jgi:hypothetical protein
MAALLINTGRACAVITTLLLCIAQLAAQTPRSVRISFLPPPLEGTISLGIYDSSGKLVRVLHREAELDAFQIGKDALITSWDGKNDAGENLPAGKYHARGFVVGDIEIEGVGFFFNDWVTDESSPRIRRIDNFVRQSGELLVLLAALSGGAGGMVTADTSGDVVAASDAPDGADFYDLVSPQRRNLRVEGGKLTLSYSADEKPVVWPELIAPQDASYGRGGTVWVIDKVDDATVVKQFSRSGEFLRRLAVDPGAPMPKLIRASETDDKIFLLEENDEMQRMRGLTLLQTKSENGEQVSEWKVEFEKKIVAHAGFTIADGKPVAVAAARAAEAPSPIPVKLQPNPLEKEKRATVPLTVGIDSAGSFLQTGEGLPLQTISDTRHLKRAVVVPEGDTAADVFQDDEAVVEQFRLSRLDQMMPFDCGDFELN